MTPSFPEEMQLRAGPALSPGRGQGVSDIAGVCATWGAQEGGITAGGPATVGGTHRGVSEQGPYRSGGGGPHHSGGHTPGGVRAGGPAAVGKGVRASRSGSPGLLHVADVGLPHHLLVVRGRLPQPQVRTSQGKSGDERSVSPESGHPGLGRHGTDGQKEKEQILCGSFQ